MVVGSGAFDMTYGCIPVTAVLLLGRFTYQPVADQMLINVRKTADVPAASAVVCTTILCNVASCSHALLGRVARGGRWVWCTIVLGTIQV